MAIQWSLGPNNVREEVAAGKLARVREGMLRWDDHAVKRRYFAGWDIAQSNTSFSAPGPTLQEEF